MSKLKTVLIDDEEKALLNLTKRIDSLFPDELEIIETFSNPEVALEFLEGKKCDLIFLDISMPEMDGFEFLERLNMPSMPVIFTTAHDEHAIKAINKHASGYVLKPIDPDILKTVVGDTIKQIRDHKDLEQKVELLQGISPSNASIAISNVDSVEIIAVNEILYITGEQGYSKIVLKDKTEVLSSKRLGYYKEILEGGNFYCIHRSYMINLSEVRKYMKQGIVEMKDGSQLPVSKVNRKEFLDKLSFN